MEKIKVNFSSAVSSFVSDSQDLSISVVWPNDSQKDGGNKYLYCAVNLFAFGF